MRRVLRLAFVCLLAVALPLQGVSAATMMACGTQQHGSHATLAEHDHHVGSFAAEGHSHVTAAETDEHASHDHASGTSDAKSSSSKHSQKCSICASCCVGAAVPAQPLSFASVKVTDHFAPLVPRSIAAFVTEGLERPPRLILA
jgi:hypothetical protein